MGRLIDIDRLCNDLAKRWNIADKKKENLIRAVMADVVTPIVVSQPTVDAVPVVRCAVCRYFRCNMRGDGTLPNGVDEFECVLGRGGYDPMDFCSEGERKDGDHAEGTIQKERS